VFTDFVILLAQGNAFATICSLVPLVKKRSATIVKMDVVSMGHVVVIMVGKVLVATLNNAQILAVVMGHVLLDIVLAIQVT